jgi:hypothetical protein
MTVTLVIEGDEAEYLGNTVDLSQDGLCLQSEVALAVGQPVGLLLGTEPKYLVKARVAWIGKVDSAQYGKAGFEFSSVLPAPLC